MRRLVLLSIMFLLGLSLLLVMGCGGPDQCIFRCESLTVDSYEKGESCGEYVYVGEETLNGCHCASNVIDCYFFPFLCGYYENELPMGNPSCVKGGFDFTLLECYGDSNSADGKQDNVKNTEERTPITAQQEVHFTVDKLSARIDSGGLEGYEDGSVSLGDIADLIDMIAMLGEDVKIQITLEYTALTELHSVTFHGDVEYSGSYVPGNFTEYFNAKDGNSSLSESYKSDNIAPGKHVITAVISLDVYECLAFEDITNISLTAYTYSED